MYSVYVHENIVNGKKYVGITSCDVKIRWKKGYGYSDQLPIGRVFRKYGWDGFTHEVLYDDLSEEEAKAIEIELIREFGTQDPARGYNICAGGEGVTGWHPSESTRAKISESAKKRTGERNPNFGHKWTDDMKRQAGEKKRRENLSEETLKRMSDAAINRNKKYGNSFQGKKHSDETKKLLSEQRSRAVMMFDINDVFLAEFSSIKNASEQTGVHKVAISNCCRGQTKTSGGYIWKYSDKCDL